MGRLFPWRPFPALAGLSVAAQLFQLREVTVPSRVRIIKFLEHVTMLQVLGSSRGDDFSRSEQGIPSQEHQEPLQNPVDLASFYFQLRKGIQ